MHVKGEKNNWKTALLSTWNWPTYFKEGHSLTRLLTSIFPAKHILSLCQNMLPWLKPRQWAARRVKGCCKGLCQYMQLPRWWQPLDGLHCHVQKKKTLMETLTVCKQLMLPIEQQVVTMWSRSEGRPLKCLLKKLARKLSPCFNQCTFTELWRQKLFLSLLCI